MNTKFSFPGLGVGEHEISNVAFRIGDFPVYWYGVIITSGILLATIYTLFRARYEKIKSDDVIDVGLWTIILGVMGGRLYYVLTSLEYYLPKPFDLVQFIKNVIDIRGGGLAIYGAIILGAMGILIVTKIKKMNTLKLMDAAAPGVMIGQLMGRWGNFCNGEAFGGIVAENHPLYFMRMGLSSDNTFSDFGTDSMVYVHPTFLYESLWNLIGFLLINAFYKKKKFNGQIACMYLAWYGFGRFFIEGLRTDSLYVGPFRISQVVGLVCFIVFGAAIVAGIVYSNKIEDKEKLNKFDEMLVPSLEMHPVFFEKKEDKKTNNDDNDNDDSDEETDENSDFDYDVTEDEKDGEDN